ncbi:hypothetical protein D3C81_1230050 [compost metagenome]
MTISDAKSHVAQSPLAGTATIDRQLGHIAVTLSLTHELQIGTLIAIALVGFAEGGMVGKGAQG